ncbi:MAG TPA: M28 family peptidase [Planctomycetota bacterium]|jgi:Zn-dependent M28 family amino/carboxypeptidase|nr:M28 family peptidase [Planctomycetota bacterium]
MKPPTTNRSTAKSFLWLGLASLSWACATSRTAPPPAAPVAPDAARLASDVRWLADDAREGRRAGTQQAKSCADWIAARMMELGLRPAGESGYLQPFTVALDARDGGTSKLAHRDVVYDTISELSTEGVHRIAPLFCSDRGEVQARLAWCGYGIENEERAWNDFAGFEKGSIAVIVRGTPPSPVAEEPQAAAGHDTQITAKSEAWGNGGSIFTKVMTAKQHGAVGVILLPAKPDEPLLRFEAGHGARAGIPAIAVDAKTAEKLAPDYRNGLDEKAATARDLGQDPWTLFADVVRDTGSAYNVLGILPGKTHDRVVVVGAHYDHLGHGGEGSLAPKATGEIHHGADDNASGTATVLEIARLLRAGGTPPCDVLVALWSGEEEGLLGSDHWTKHPTIPLAKVSANLNLDMVGRAGNGKLQVLGAGTSPEFAGWMKEAGAASGLDLTVSTQGGALGGSSDHQSFLKNGIPALHLFSGLHGDYHKPSDTADKFEAAGAAKVAVLGVDFVDRMASAGKLAFVEPKIDKDREQQVQGGFHTRFGAMPSYAYDGKGVLMDGTSGDSPAERAGFLKGDVILGMGDVKIDNVYDLMYALQLFKPGDVVVVKFTRDGKDQETRVTLASPLSQGPH